MYTKEQFKAVKDEITRQTILDDSYLQDKQIYLNPKEIIKNITVSRSELGQILADLESKYNSIQVLNGPQAYGSMDEKGNFDSSKPFKIAYDCYLINIEEKFFKHNDSTSKKKENGKEIKREAKTKYAGYEVFDDGTIEYKREEVKLTGQKLFILKCIIESLDSSKNLNSPEFYWSHSKIKGLLISDAPKTYKEEMSNKTITKYICTIRNELVSVIEKVTGEHPENILKSTGVGYCLRIIP